MKRSTRNGSERRFEFCLRNWSTASALRGFQPDLMKGAFHLRGQRDNRLLGVHAGPEGASAPSLEFSDTGHTQIEGARAQILKRCSNVVGQRPLHLSDKAQCQMQLLI